MIWKTLLLLLVLAVCVIALATALFAILGSRRGCAEKWARNAFTATVGVIFISGVVTAAALSIRALRDLESDMSLGAYETPDTQLSVSATPYQTARPIYTPPPGTVITLTPKPEVITGVNYGAGFALTECNDYVYVMQDSLLYSGPAESYGEVGSVSAGATLSRKGYTEDWSLVDYGGNYCFIPTELLIVNE